MRSLPLSLCFVVVAAAGCPAKVATVEISPPKVELRSDNQTKQLSATAKDLEGNVLEGERVVAWKTADPAVATIDSAGMVKPAGTGTTTVTATIEEQSASIPIAVILLKRIQLQSPAMVVVAGVPSEPLALNFMNERGEPLPPEDRKVRWKTADPAIAVVSDAGVVTGVTAGSTLLTAEVNELKAEMTVTVNPPPEPEPEPVPEVVPGKKPKAK